MSPILTERRFWLRLAAVTSAVWLGAMAIASQIARDFRWTGWSDALGPAAYCTFFGIVVIFAVCLGVPWIAKAAKPR